MDFHVETNDMPEFLGQLVDVVEDMLDGQPEQVRLPRSEAEKAQTKDSEPDAAIIYGEDYDILSDGFREVVNRWKKEETK